MNLGTDRMDRCCYCAFSILALFAIFLTGCKDNVVLPNEDQLAVFRNAGPIEPELDLDLLVDSKKNVGLYKLTCGDMLEIQMPQVLQAVTADYSYSASSLNPAGHFCRVFDNGKITLPIIGQLAAEGKTLSELEQSITEAYYPKYCKNRPSVVANIRQYRTSKVSISGAVEKPGVYELKNDQMSLVSLLMEAGGIRKDGAAVIYVDHNDNKPQESSGQHSALSGQQKNKTAEGGSNSLKSKANGIKHSSDKTQNSHKPEPVKFDLDGEITDSELKFRYRPNPYNDTGTIIASKGDKDIYIKTIKVTDPLQRIRFAKDLVLQDGSISALDALKHLSRLAEAVEPGSGSFDLDVLGDNARQELVELLKQQDSFDRQYAEKSGSGDLNSPESDAELTKNLLNILTADADLEKKEPETAVPQLEGTKLAKKDGPLVLPVKGLNIPFADVALTEGTSVQVKALDPKVFTVVGLVGRSGVFPYPPNVQYNLMQALAFAGGVDEIADPRYVRVYRQDASGQIVDASFEITGTSVVGAPNIAIKPGDVVSVEQTPRTKKNLLIAEILQLRVGATATAGVTDITYRGKDIRSGK